MKKTQEGRSFQSQIEDALFALDEASLKRTQPRLALLEALIENHGPYSIEEIHKLVRSKKLDLVTVYRCVGLFEKIGLVRRCDFGDGTARYEFQMGYRHHHHVICKVCRKAQSLETCELNKFDKLVKKMGYTEVTHTLEFFGVCETCQAA